MKGFVPISFGMAVSMQQLMVMITRKWLVKSAELYVFSILQSKAKVYLFSSLKCRNLQIIIM